jgi:hypothetical protein
MEAVVDRRPEVANRSFPPFALSAMLPIAKSISSPHRLADTLRAMPRTELSVPMEKSLQAALPRWFIGYSISDPAAASPAAPLSKRK